MRTSPIPRPDQVQLTGKIETDELHMRRIEQPISSCGMFGRDWATHPQHDLPDGAPGAGDVHVEGRPWAINLTLQGRPQLPHIRLLITRRPGVDHGAAEGNIGEREHSQIHHIHSSERSDDRLSWRDRAFCRDLVSRIHRKPRHPRRESNP
jgi:hypothetical protein